MNISQWVRQNFKPNDWALVTGTTSGIGNAYAHALAKEKCNLICASNEGSVLEEQKTIFEKTYGIKVHNVCVDLTDKQSTLNLTQSLTEYSIKILINNAGIGMKGLFETNPTEKYIDLMYLNVVAPVVILREILPQMQSAKSGLVITISSINSLLPIPKNQVYTATKSFCSNFASAVAHENIASGVDFQLVLPGTTRTPFHDKQGANPKHMTMTPEDVVFQSLKNVKKDICIPNRADRVLAKLVPLLPLKFKMNLASYILTKRLGI